MTNRRLLTLSAALLGLASTSVSTTAEARIRRYRPPAPTPAPTPPPAPTTDTTFFNDGVDQTFSVGLNRQNYSNGGGGGGYGPANFSYDTETGSYTIAYSQYNVLTRSYTPVSSTFVPAQRSSTASDATFTVFTKTNGPTTETLRLFNNGPANPRMVLTYSSYGHWKSVTSDGSITPIVSNNYFTFGTPATDVPNTGTASYSTALDGIWVKGTVYGQPRVEYALSGSSSFVANFGNSTFSLTASPIGTSASGAVINFGTINSVGNISSSASFSGVTPTGTYDPAEDYFMSVQGRFYGPGAAEMGATFHLMGPGGGGNGVIFGVKQ